MSQSRLLLETDSPHLRPPSVRHGPNSPSNIHEIAGYVAEQVGMTPAEVMREATANARVFYRI